MFNNCTQLTSLNLTNFKNSLTINMKGMFQNCEKLSSLDLSYFNTERVEIMSDMFNGCNSLTSLDLSNFDTSHVTDMQNMFNNCSSLFYLNISNFNTELMDNYYSTNNIKSQMFEGISNNFYYCLFDEDYTKYIFKELSLLNNSIRDCSENCFPEQRFFLKERQHCFLNCRLSETHKFEYKKRCYINCPRKTEVLKNYSNLCEDLFCEKKNLFYDYEQHSCIKEIPENYYLNDTIFKTIDHCDSNCRTCDEAATENNMNCKSCPPETSLYYGNCTNNCPNGFFLDKEDTTKKICKCENTKCFYCSLQALNLNLCDLCNEEMEYFPILNDPKNIKNYFDCYISPDGYYLDRAVNYYKKCYPTCKNCNGPGIVIDNNCTQCIENYIKRDDYPNDNNCYKNCEKNNLYYFFYDKGNFSCTVEKKCPKIFNKLIPQKNKCVDNCLKDEVYKYEFRKTCYEKCPQEPYKSTPNDVLYCEIKCPIDFPYEFNETQTCVKRCNSTEDRAKNLCYLNNIEADVTIEEKEILISAFQEKIANGGLDDLIGNITNKKTDSIVRDNGATYTFTTSENQNNNENNNITTIKLGDCENKLRFYYDIPEQIPLLIFKIDVYEEGLKFPKIEYEVYNPNNHEKLNLNVCQNTKVDLSIPIPIDENEIDLYNSSSGFYNDICYTYTSDKGTDISLDDRKKEFVDKNMSVCEENCEFTGYDLDTKKAICSCEVKIKLPLMSEISFDKNRLYDSFTNIKNIANMKILNCYHVLFSKNGFIKNIGSYIVISIILIPQPVTVDRSLAHSGCSVSQAGTR